VPILLRDYQEAAKQAVRASMRKHRRVLLCLPTRGGKTVIFSSIAEGAASRGKSVYIRAHRIEIIEQISATLKAFGVQHGVVAPGHRETTCPVQVGMVQTLKNRAYRLPAPDLLITDEAHHRPAGSYDVWNDVFELGVTATPGRLDGEPLGAFYDDLVFGPTMKELQSRGFLARYRYFCPPPTADFSGLKKRAGDYAKDQLSELMSRRAIVGDAEQHYRRLLNGKPTIGFCCDVKSAFATAEYFRSAGWNAAAVDGSMDAVERRRRIGAVGTGELNALFSCDVVSEGVDLPALYGAILLRKTASIVIQQQQVGRPLNPTKDGAPVFILDHVNNVAEHGLPDAERNWSLSSAPVRPQASAVRQCPACYLCTSPVAKCPSCGYDFVAAAKANARRSLEQVAGDLQEVGAAKAATEARKPYKQQLSECRSVDDLRAMARRNNYDWRWAKRMADFRKWEWDRRA
jgi:superfamily II DNA or RNA helicase